MTFFHTSLNSPFGPLSLFEEGGALIVLEWGRPPNVNSSPLLERATRQLTEYFDGSRHTFDLPLRPAGTPFQHRVWAAMQTIPFGQTETYGALAIIAGGGPRAVGMACGANPIPIIIPCHRVVGAGGKMIGYSGGHGIETKHQLLQLEGAQLI